MSRIYDALKQSAKTVDESDVQPLELIPENGAIAELPSIGSRASELEEVPVFSLHPRDADRLVALSEEGGMAAEKVRMLITRLRHIRRRRPFCRLLISSTVRGEGKSLMAANLALALARQNQKTLLLDGDLRRPTLSRLFDLTEEPGLSEWWLKQESVTPFLRRLQGSPLWFLPAGTALEQPAELLQSRATVQLLGMLGQLFDWVIIDSPPVGPIADAGSWVTLTDAVLLVVRSGLTPKKLLRQGLDLLDRSKIIGIVMNDAQCVDQRYYRGYYGSPAKP